MRARSRAWHNERRLPMPLCPPCTYTSSPMATCPYGMRTRWQPSPFPFLYSTRELVPRGLACEHDPSVPSSLPCSDHGAVYSRSGDRPWCRARASYDASPCLLAITRVGRERSGRCPIHEATSRPTVLRCFPFPSSRREAVASSGHAIRYSHFPRQQASYGSPLAAPARIAALADPCPSVPSVLFLPYASLCRPVQRSRSLATPHRATPSSPCPYVRSTR